MPHRPAACRILHLAILLSLAASGAGALLAQQAGETYNPADDRPPDVAIGINGDMASRDNTRVIGTVRDPYGNPMDGIEIVVRNHEAPAAQLIARTRKTGTYLIRGVNRLWSRENITGITLRLTFDADGYEEFETTVGVAKDGLAELHPILWEEGEERNLAGWCVIVKGQVTDSRGKKVKKPHLIFSSEENPEFRVEVDGEKSGAYEALLWAAPTTIQVAVAAAGRAAFEDSVAFGGEPVNDRVRVMLKDIRIP